MSELDKLKQKVEQLENVNSNIRQQLNGVTTQCGVTERMLAHRDKEIIIANTNMKLQETHIKQLNDKISGLEKELAELKGKIAKSDAPVAKPEEAKKVA